MKQTATATFGLLAVAALAFAAISLQAGASPQSRSRSGAAAKPGPTVTLAADNQRVPALIQQIMAAAHANYTIDSSLAESYATVKLKNVPVEAALSALSRTSTRPFMYERQSGIYRFVPTGSSNLDWQRVTLDVQNTSLPGTISALMKQAHADYILDREIAASLQGAITMNLTSVPFPTALESLVQASSVPIAYRVESQANGLHVYHFMTKAKGIQADNIASGKLRFTDSSLENDAALTDKKITQEFEGVYLSHALKSMLDTVPLRYEIDASVEDRLITQRLENIPLPTAIKLLIKASTLPIEFHFENDVLRFSRKAK